MLVDFKFSSKNLQILEIPEGISHRRHVTLRPTQESFILPYPGTVLCSLVDQQGISSETPKYPFAILSYDARLLKNVSSREERTRVGLICVFYRVMAGISRNVR